MRSYLFQKLGSLEVRDDCDLKGMRALKDAAATAVLVASQCDDPSVMTDLFDLVHQRLTSKLRHDLHLETGAQRNVDKIVPFLEKECKILVATELSCGKQFQPKRQERRSEERG